MKAAVLLATLALAPAALAQSVGQATRVQSGASQQAGGAPAALATGDAVLWQARLGTDATGSTEVTFTDGTRLTMGPNAQVTVDDYVYAPGGAQAMSVTLGKGFLRMISGRIDKQGVRVGTPVAALGIRGTDFTLDTRVPNLLRIWLEEGAIFVVPVESGLTFEYQAPARVDCTLNVCRQIAESAPPRAFQGGDDGGRRNRFDPGNPDNGDSGGGGGNSRN